MSDDITLEPGMVLSDVNNQLMLVVGVGNELCGVWFSYGMYVFSSGGWDTEVLLEHVKAGKFKIIGKLDGRAIEKAYNSKGPTT